MGDAIEAVTVAIREAGWFKVDDGLSFLVQAEMVGVRG